ncbi:MAG: metallophosphoesterase [Opitutales bacterium]|jgi:predicted phosphodiesterase
MSKLRIEKLPQCEGRTLIIGDVHGCLEEMALVLKQFKPTPDDRILTVGDLINRGPDSRATIDFARENGIRSVLGNHEKRLLKAWRNGGRSQLKNHSRKTFAILTEDDFQWIDSWPHIFNIPSLKSLVVHGGFVPGKKWKRQSAFDVTYVQVIDRHGHPAKRADAPKGRPWADFYEGKKHVFYGHTPRPHPLLHARATGLDTGCVYGGELTAVSLPDFSFYRASAKRPYIKD